MSGYLLYPGCSLDTGARAYDESLHAIAGPLGLELTEIDDWNCCGATEYLGINLIPAYALIGRNLALAGPAGQRHPYRRGPVQRVLPQPRQGRSLHAGAADPR